MAYKDDITKIENLLDKYYEANTSIQEELELKEFFLNNEVPPHLEYDKLQFTFFDQENKLESKTDLPEFKSEDEKLNISRKPKVFKLMNYAAAAALLISVGWFSNNKYQDHIQEQAEIQFAYQETQKALLILSNNFNKGVDKASSLKEMNKAQTKLINTNY